MAITDDGLVAAHSTISVPGHGKTDASQWGTFVHREHRGHRLGLATKAANLLAVQRAHPAMRRIVTQNAETNQWMIAVNEQMGFEPVEASMEFVRSALNRTSSPGRSWAHCARSSARTTPTTG